MPAARNHAPQGSQFEKLRPKKKAKRKRKAIRRAITSRLEAFTCILLPLIYRCYMRFVWFTSKITDNYSHPIGSLKEKNGGIVAALWHQDVFTSPHVFRPFHAHTLANTKTLGRLVTSLLEDNNFRVFRGGHNRQIILRDMILHMKANPKILYGITVDGSKGPARIMKRGASLIAKDCGVPIFVVRTQAKHALYMNTWDRTAIPLPFNKIETSAVGPYWIDPDCTAETFNAFCEHIQQELLNLTDYIDRKLNDGESTHTIQQDFPKDWTGSDWLENTSGRAQSEWDLQTEQTPPWSYTNRSTKPTASFIR
jgi:lysophospholipid acyltransferase (LPLAT)-like uncharacterized protein